VLSTPFQGEIFMEVEHSKGERRIFNTEDGKIALDRFLRTFDPACVAGGISRASRLSRERERG
jgi:hypothetical protein